MAGALRLPALRTGCDVVGFVGWVSVSAPTITQHTKTLELNLPGREKRRAAAGRRAPTDRKLRVEVVRHQYVAGKIAVGRHQRLLVAVMLNQHAQLFHPRLKFGL